MQFGVMKAMLQRDSAILIEYIDDGNSIIVHKAYLNTKTVLKLIRRQNQIRNRGCIIL